MANHRHIQIVDYYEPVDFESRGFVKSEFVERDATTHSPILRNAYTEAIAAFKREDDILQGVVESVGGTYLNFQVAKASLVEESLDTTRGAQLMNVRPVDGNGAEEQVTLFLPQERINWFNRKLNEYDRNPDVVVDENGEEKTKKRKNQRLVNAVSDIQAARLQHFFSLQTDLLALQDGVARDIEVWFAEETYDDDTVKEKLRALGILHGARTLVFNQVIILLVNANAHQLMQIVHSLRGVTEFRIYHDPSVLLSKNEVGTSEWMHLIQQDIIRADDPLVRIAVLDTGVNPNHPLLSDFLPSERCVSAIASGNTLDQENHGTGLASLALYGDLTDVIYSGSRVRITSDLSSVKLLSLNEGERNKQEMYALITEDAILQGKESGACILCSAVTDKDHSVDDARASSTSAAIDETLYNDGKCDSVFLISAGNVEQRLNGLPYPDYLYLENIQDPAQAWNAITVGAYTNKVAIHDPSWANQNVVAPADGISPFSRTSVLWGANAVKPEILMEGGNSILYGDTLASPEDLSLIVAHAGNGLVPGGFDIFNATSAATGLATRLAAKIKYYNPNLKALSIRALMIHSADWTQEMKDMCTDHGILNVKTLLHSCGYGVPDEKKAIVSSDSRVTFIAEDVIKPFTQGSANKLKFGYMNLYKMPWPKDLLMSLGDQTVRLKITLSYYIKPSPGIRSHLNKYSYQSIRLKFDVCGPQETVHEFENRIKHLVEDGEVRSRDPELANRWTIGIINRNQGSICSDSFEATGASMAACDTIAIYPSGGWFKNRLENLDMEIPYSLVVTLESPLEEVMLYNEVEAAIAQRIPIAVGL